MAKPWNLSTLFGVLVIWTYTLLDYGNSAEIYQANCREVLGMQSGAIPDHAIKASSSYDAASVGPQNGRIRTERKGGAWCPRKQIYKEVYEWLEVDLQEVTMVTLVETQGRFGNGQGQEYAEAYALEFQRKLDGPWIKFRDRRGKEVFTGNSNTYMPELREIKPPIIARKIRIIPHSTHPRTVCMRVEFYGCPWKDGVISYSMRQGDRRGQEVDLYDFSYDGKIQDGYLSGGLGQLIDTQEGPNNFRLDQQGLGRKGYEWIGWKNESVISPPAEIVFEFDRVRNFTEVRFHCNNMYLKDVRVFRKALLYFSVGGKYYMEAPVVYEYMRDTVMEYARIVIIPIPHRVGQFIKVHLFFDSRWLLISEVRFESEVVTGNVSLEIPPPNLSTTPIYPTDINGESKFMEVDWLPDSGNTGPTRMPSESQESKSLDDQYIGIIIGSGAALIILLMAIVLFVVFHHRKRKSGNGNPEKVVQPPQHVTLDLNDLRAMTENGKCSLGNIYNSINNSDVDSDRECHARNGKLVNGDVYRDPFDGIQTRRLPELPKTPDSTTDTNTSRDYAVPDVTQSSFMPHPRIGGGNANGYAREESVTPPLPPHPSILFGGLGVGSLQGLSGNSLCAVPNNLELLWKDDLSVMEFPRENLKFVEKIGEGQFGEVHLCEALRITDFLGDDFLVNRTGNSRAMLVAVKMLRHDVDELARDDFHKELKVMSRLKDPNIVRVLGVCTRDQPLCVIVEYMKYGDLNQFLQQHVPQEGSSACNNNLKTLSYGCLIFMATQVASGMKYLETLNMVHRDLASRNCLVGNQFTIKISDFGMSRSLYSNDYYRIEGKAVLPIRWMAWESVLLGKFSSKSDIWSFGVTLWEILTFCREQPFDSLSDEQVIENCGHYYRSDGLEACPWQPGNCPKEIFDLMKECWNREETHRPAFREIHMFLQRKNMGYNPRDERNTPTRERIAVPVV